MIDKKILKFEAGGREFAKFLRLLEQFIQTVKGQNNFLYQNVFLTCSWRFFKSNKLEQEQVKKAFCYQKLFWPFTVWTNCSSYLKIFANSQPSASNFNFFSRSLEHFFLTVDQNNLGNKIPFFLTQNYKWVEMKSW